jgi:hypothetical protein
MERIGQYLSSLGQCTYVAANSHNIPGDDQERWSIIVYVYLLSGGPRMSQRARDFRRSYKLSVAEMTDIHRRAVI